MLHSWPRKSRPFDGDENRGEAIRAPEVRLQSHIRKSAQPLGATLWPLTPMPSTLMLAERASAGLSNADRARFLAGSALELWPELAAAGAERTS